MIQILPWMTMISSTGRPADLKVNSRISITNSADRMEISRLSSMKEELRSMALVVLPTT